MHKIQGMDVTRKNFDFSDDGILADLPDVPDMLVLAADC